MYIKKLHEKYFDNNDIYTLEIYKNNICTNDNYDGLLYLNTSLNNQKIIPLNKETTIYFIYKEYQGKHLLLYSPEQAQMIFVNLDNGKNYPISISQSINEHTFSPIYYWHNDTLIITTYNAISYSVCLKTYTLKEISASEIKQISPVFFNFWNVSKNYMIETSYSEQYSFIFKKNNSTIGFLNTRTNDQRTINNNDDTWHDVEYCNDKFVFIYENKLEIMDKKNTIIFQPKFGYIFLKAKFISPSIIIILSSKLDNPKKSLLQTFNILI